MIFVPDFFLAFFECLAVGALAVFALLVLVRIGTPRRAVVTARRMPR